MFLIEIFLFVDNYFRKELLPENGYHPGIDSDKVYVYFALVAKSLIKYLEEFHWYENVFPWFENINRKHSFQKTFTSLLYTCQCWGCWWSDFEQYIIFYPIFFFTDLKIWYLKFWGIHSSGWKNTDVMNLWVGIVYTL